MPGIYVLQALAQEPQEPRIAMARPCIYVLQAERRKEAARIAFPKRRNLQEAEAERQEFIRWFPGTIWLARVRLSKVFGRKDLASLRAVSDYRRLEFD